MLPVLLLATLARAADRPPDPAIQQIVTQLRQYGLAPPPPATDHGDRPPRFLEDIELPKTSISEAARLLNSQRPDGSWPDIDYPSAARSSWPAFDHLTRLLALTVYARSPQTPGEQSTRALAAAHAALDFWGKNDFKCPNWWYNNIGVPKILGAIALLLDKDLTPLEHDYIADVVMPRSRLGAMTGQNKVWIAGNNVMLAALTNDVPLMRRATATIADEIAIAKIQLGIPDEGIQPDYSFHQHGPQEQFGNYGLAFATDITRWAIILRNTRYAFSEDKIDILRHYLLDGLNWTCWKGEMDISACGRELFPDSPRTKANTVAAIMQSMSLVDTVHARDYTAFVDRNLHASPDAANDLHGTRYFYKSDYLIERSAPPLDLMSTLKMHSNRIIGGETVNSENLAGNHLADGATFFYRSGDEYADIFPVWNWRMIPGTTSLLDESPLSWVKTKSKNPNDEVITDAPKPTATRPVDIGLPPLPISKYTRPTGPAFVGGACDGQHAAIAMDFNRDGLTAHKAYFYSRGITLCLGAAINSSSEAVALTTINQCLLHGDIRLNETTLHAPTDFTGTAKTVEHDGLLYYFPTPIEFNLHAGPTTGTWKSVYDTPSTPAADVTKDLFTLAIFHGIKPKDAYYAYAVCPATNLPTLKLLPENRMTVLSNTAALQAAQIDDAVAIVFWTPGAFTTHTHTIQVDHPCAVLFTLKDEEPHLVLADPTQSLADITLELDGHAHTLHLPADQLAGSTVDVAWGSRP